MEIQVEAQHRWLQQLIGEWTFTVESPALPDCPGGNTTGRERVRALGDLWIVAEGEGEMPGGGTALTLMTLGYDPQQQYFVGTWVGSMMTHLWLYKGSLDERQSVLALATLGPDMAESGTLVGYRDAIELKSRDHRVLTSSVQEQDGVWRTFMTAHYRRTK